MESFGEEPEYASHGSSNTEHEEDEGNTQKHKNDVDDSLAYLKMTPMQKKLFDLKMKMNKARKDNQSHVIEEDRRKKEGSQADYNREQKVYDEEKKKERKEIEEKGGDPELQKILNTTATEAEWRDKKRKKKSESFGWDQYNPESHFNAYKKRIGDVKFDPKNYREQRDNVDEDEFYRDSNSLTHGQTPDIPAARVNAMVEELEKSIEKRKTFSRRRLHYDEAYVDYISDRNKVFNKKIGRAYDKYTSEIKNNLERGTAI